jgi:acetyl esterase/lipase
MYSNEFILNRLDYLRYSYLNYNLETIQDNISVEKITDNIYRIKPLIYTKTIIYVHGGGFILGDFHFYKHLC